jgi:hypothetical protein
LKLCKAAHQWRVSTLKPRRCKLHVALDALNSN